MNSSLSEDSLRGSAPGDDMRVYFVPHRWWKEAQSSALGDSNGNKGVLFTASPGASSVGPMKIFNTFFNSDLVFNLRRGADSGLNDDSGELGISGRDYALVPGEMWLQALKWHSDSKVAMREGRTFSAAEGDTSDVYPLQLRLSVLPETNTVAVKMSRKDNAAEFFRRACKIFCVDSDPLRIWDFSGQTTLYLSEVQNNFPKESLQQSYQEIFLELQIYGLSDGMKCKEGKSDEAASQHSNSSGSGTTFLMNGSTGNRSLIFPRTGSCQFSEAGSLGLIGLQNLGNTCFMNCALQCLAHTPKLSDYFLGDYGREINNENPLGMKGELALAFGDLLRKLWASGATPVAPRMFKSKLACFVPQFSGFNQHDSQEFLSFLLDGLHEDLNRVKCKPCIVAMDGEDRPDEEVADEYWRNHLAHNDSIIVDVCQGQYRSTLVCPLCRKVSVMFDPFMYLSLPLPSAAMRTMTLTVMTTDGSARPTPYTITVPKNGRCSDFIQALRFTCSLGADESLLLAEIYNSCIICYLEEPTDSLSLIRDDDQLVAYRIPRDTEKVSLVVFMHQLKEDQYIHGKVPSSWKTFGIPLVARLENCVNGSDICKLYLMVLAPFLRAGFYDNRESTGAGEARENMNGEVSDAEFEMCFTDDKGMLCNSKIVMNDPLAMPALAGHLNVLVRWQAKQFEQYDTQLLCSLPEIFKAGLSAKGPRESISLYKCLEAFLKEEPLGPEDMWYCPRCKKHQQASKKLDLWRLPKILVIHLKRFSYNRSMKHKLESYVDFPVENLDLSEYIGCKKGESPNCYMLYAVSNHYGGMGGGHYTAFVHHGGDRWYEFDDSHVYPICKEKIQSSAAYVLFYRRV